MNEHIIGQIMKSVAKAGQPLHKIIQVTAHARQSWLDDYDKTTVSERRQLSHITREYAATSTSSVIVQS
ncbi:hypothetical protein pdam_00023231 [Pocillopora damicornis]|uniref:Uncharacterized protein n=1 Tax=Pocillopora damicornis TaxID=46731 RepID=A0A3M6TYI2_POCDA|nr:hypothetical protein pdam_00023231 [Pocillopora damicornis]